jgi:exodeoxyribonuclease III
MILTTWNLGGGDKRAAVDGLGSDFSLLQERRVCDVGDGELWGGDEPTKGVSARCAAPYRLEPIRTRRNLPRYFIPQQVSGPESFQLISVWAMNDGRDLRYVRGLVRAVERWADRIEGQPTVIAGDFNANAVWDKQHPRDRNFTALARRLGDLGLVSAYHAFYGEDYGRETRPTFFLYKHLDKPFHLDYCFIPQTWLPRLTNVTVGAHADWARWSDHMPVTVELSSPGPSPSSASPSPPG